MRLVYVTLLVAALVPVSVGRVYRVYDGVIKAPVRALQRDGCPCVKKSVSGKCCTFRQAVPQAGSGQRAACTCRTCRSSYRCAKKSSTYCVYKSVRAGAHCVDPRNWQCVLPRGNMRVLVPRALTTRKGGRRKAVYDVFVAGRARCWVYHGASRRVILRTRRKPIVYHRANVALSKCSPIRVKCMRSRHGVLVALKFRGRFYGTGMRGTRCVVSGRRPRNWHSTAPSLNSDDTEIVRDITKTYASWQEMSELTGARPVRARGRRRSVFVYALIVPPFCSK